MCYVLKCCSSVSIFRMWCMWPLTADCYQFSQMLMYSSLPDFQTMKIRDQYTNLQISVLYITDKLVNVDNFVLKYWKVVRKIHQVALLTESCSRTKKLPKTWKVAEKLPSNLWKGLPVTKCFTLSLQRRRPRGDWYRALCEVPTDHNQRSSHPQALAVRSRGTWSIGIDVNTRRNGVFTVFWKAKMF